MPPKKPHFASDNDFTKFYENVMMSLVTWTDAIPAPPKRWTDWDMKIRNGRRVDTYELKADRRTEGTGNLAIEMNSFGWKSGKLVIKPSGLNTTKADYYAYFNHNSPGREWWLIPTEVLKTIVDENKPKFYAWVGEQAREQFMTIDMGEYKGKTMNDVKMEVSEQTGGIYANARDLNGTAFCGMFPKSLFSQYKMAPWTNWLVKKDGKYVIPNYMDITYEQMGAEGKIVQDISTLEKPTNVTFTKEEVGGEETMKIVHQSPTKEQETQTEEPNGKEMTARPYVESTRPDVEPVKGRKHRISGQAGMEYDIDESLKLAEKIKGKTGIVPGGRVMTATPRDINAPR